MKMIRIEKDGIFLENYLEYLDTWKESFPDNAKDFANLPYHYDLSDRRCPHDSWLESVSITENGSGPRSSNRKTTIEARFLGSYHDGYFSLEYVNVAEFDIGLADRSENLSAGGRGDWIVDEMSLADNRLISHEIVFSRKGAWYVLCQDIIYSWVPLIN